MIPTLYLLVGVLCSGTSFTDCIPAARSEAFERLDACEKRGAEWGHEQAAEGKWGSTVCVVVTMPTKGA